MSQRPWTARPGARVTVLGLELTGVVVEVSTGGRLVLLVPGRGMVAANIGEVLPEPTDAECAAVRLPAWLQA